MDQVSKSLLISGGGEAAPANPAKALVYTTSGSAGSIYGYSWDNTLGFTGAYDLSPNYFDSTGYAITFNSAGDKLITGGNAGVIRAFNWGSQGITSEFSTSDATTFGSNPRRITFNKTETAVAFAPPNSSTVGVWQWSNAVGFGTRYTSPTTGGTQGWDVDFHPNNSSIAIAHAGTPHVSVYQWNDATGFGTKYANPAGIPGGTSGALVVKFHPNGNYIVWSSSEVTPFINAYPWNETTGFGTKLANPASLPTTAPQDLIFTKDGTKLIVGAGSLYGYNWNNGFGTLFSPPSQPAGGSANTLALSPDEKALAVGHASSPFISVYQWSSAGFGNKYADPSVLPNGTPNQRGLAWGTIGEKALWKTYYAVSTDISPFIRAGKFSGGIRTAATSPATLPGGTCRGADFNHTATALAVAGGSAPQIKVYPWSDSGFGTKYADPAVAPEGSGMDIQFTPADDAIILAMSTTPWIAAWAWNNTTGFGTRYSNPAVLPTGQGTGISINSDGTAVAMSHSTTPFITVYSWNSATGFGTKYSNPSTLPPNTGQDVKFSSDNSIIAVAHNTTPFLSVYPWNNSTGFGTKYANPATLSTNSAFGIDIHPNVDAIALASISTPFIHAWPWNTSTGFGTKYANPTTLPPGIVYDVAFSPDGEVLACVGAGASPWARGYSWNSSTGFGSRNSLVSTTATTQAFGIDFRRVSNI